MKKILFIFAHPDDESFGPAATIADLATRHEVHVMALCNGARPGAASDVQFKRGLAFSAACRKLNARPWQWGSNDCSLQPHETTSFVCGIVATHKPDIIFTHSGADVHLDHRIVSDACLVASRPTAMSTVEALYHCEVPPSTMWGFEQHGTFNPNLFVDITDWLDLKQKLILSYGTEVHDYPDGRSLGSIIDLARHRGSQSGVAYAEAFQQVFARGHIAL